MNEKVAEKALDNIAEEFNEHSKGAGENFGKAALGISKIAKGTVETCLAPFNFVIWGYDKIKDKFIPLVAKKLQNLPQEQIQTPKTNLAGPAIEALRFSAEEPELQNMFANLLATAMDKQTSEDAHPSFVEIIKQLSPDEAKILYYMKDLYGVPVIDVKSFMKNPNQIFIALPNFSLLGFKSKCTLPESIQTYIDNLCRLRIFEIPHDVKLADEVAYQELQNSPHIETILKNIKEESGKDPVFIHKKLSLTTYGRQFIKACIINRDEIEPEAGL
jgi:hypothetical protein